MQPRIDSSPSEPVEAPGSPKPKRKRHDRSRTAIAYPRKRAVAACKPCRAKKVKCDNARPQCGACRGTFPSSCSYDDGPNLSTFDPASIAILEQLGQVLEHVRHLGPSSSRDSPGQLLAETSQPPLGSSSVGPQTIDGPHSMPGTTVTGIDITTVNDTSTQGRVAADTILAWPVFSNKFPSKYLLDGLYDAELETHDAANEYLLNPRQAPAAAQSRYGGFNEDEVPQLVQRFLQHVHVKNPITDSDILIALSQQVMETGIAWDSASCLILIVCALGSVAYDFAEPNTQHGDKIASLDSSLDGVRDDIARADAYFNLARRRFGLLEAGLMSIQCHYLAGVYLMYTMRPLKAWTQIDTASRKLCEYLRCQARRPPSAEKPRRLRSLEQRLYWSCFKSQVELQLDLDLPPGPLGSLDYPDLFPLPPELGPAGQSPSTTDPLRDDGSSQRNESAWFYYLTEISLRRFSDRIVQAFHLGGHTTWTVDRIGSMIHVAKELDDQLEDSLQRLPEVLRREYEPGRAVGELAFCIRGIFADLRSLIHRPFLYYAMHNPPTAPHWEAAEALAIRAFPPKHLFWHGRHRHHGSWFGVGWMFSAAVMILGALHSTHYMLPPGRDWLGFVRKCRSEIAFWTEELPAVSRACEVIDHYLQALPGTPL